MTAILTVRAKAKVPKPGKNGKVDHLQWQEREDFPRISGLKYSEKDNRIVLD